MSESELFRFERSGQRGQASLAVDLAVRSPHRVSPLLYGKFCEHLGFNIYQGMDAQILYNPTFGQLEVNEHRIRRLAERVGRPDASAVTAAYADGAAIGWVRVGQGQEVVLSPDTGPHGGRAQRFETPGGSADRPGGIGQWTYLPLHRTRGYEFRLAGRTAQPCEVELAPGRRPGAQPVRTWTRWPC
ncbi:MAG: hypothetical protein B1H04_03080 [Planctomycetales bacterium 4484_123]|nr:MAG: hypothetical protein B1H04_03080 [Planctomycetales bacterium 4484_123]